jgi:hypothetical protein
MDIHIYLLGCRKENKIETAAVWYIKVFEFIKSTSVYSQSEFWKLEKDRKRKHHTDTCVIQLTLKQYWNILEG